MAACEAHDSLPHPKQSLPHEPKLLLNQGGTVDMYSPSSNYPIVSVGPVGFASAGTHTIRLTVTGKNASAFGYLLTADVLTLTPQ